MTSRWQCWCKWTTINKQTPLEREEKCDVTLPWWQNHDLDLNNLSWQGRPFACSNDGKVWATVLFLSAIMHKKGIHVNFFVLFVAWTTVCSDFDTMATRHSDVSSSVFFWFAPLRMKGHITDRYLSALFPRNKHLSDKAKHLEISRFVVGGR